MPIWMLLVYAVCMTAAALSFAAWSSWTGLAYPVFVVSLVIFVLVLLVRGVRRPVV